MLSVLVKQLRERSQMSLGAWSVKSGIARTTLWRWERGDTLPREAELNVALDALTISIAERRKAIGMLHEARFAKSLDLALPQSTTGINRGELLRALRLRRNWSQRDAAEQLGINRVTLANWERGDHWTDAATLHQVCQLYQASPEEIATLTALPELYDQQAVAEEFAWDDIETFVGNFAEMELRYLAARSKLSRQQTDPNRQEEMRCLLDYLHFLILQGRSREVRREAHRLASHPALRRFPTLYARFQILIAVAQPENPRGYAVSSEILGGLIRLGDSVPQEEGCRAKSEWADILTKKGERETALQLSLAAIADAQVSGDEHLLGIARRGHTATLINLREFGAASKALEEFPVHTPLFAVQKIFTQGMLLHESGAWAEASRVYNQASGAAHGFGMTDYANHFQKLADALA